MDVVRPERLERGHQGTNLPRLLSHLSMGPVFGHRGRGRRRLRERALGDHRRPTGGQAVPDRCERDRPRGGDAKPGGTDELRVRSRVGGRASDRRGKSRLRLFTRRASPSPRPDVRAPVHRRHAETGRPALDLRVLPVRQSAILVSDVVAGDRCRAQNGVEYPSRSGLLPPMAISRDSRRRAADARRRTRRSRIRTVRRLARTCARNDRG